MFSPFGFFLPQFHLALAAAPEKMHFSSFYSIKMVDCLYLYLSVFLYIISIRHVKPCLGRKRLRSGFIRVSLVTVGLSGALWLVLLCLVYVRAHG